MNKQMLFTDGSVHVQSKIGYGAYLFIDVLEISLEVLKSRVQLKRFEQTSSTKLELQTLIWALADLPFNEQKLYIYTDSQNILSLIDRRERLEKMDYFTKKNTRLKNFELYQEFFTFYDKLDLEIIKVAGHKVSHQKNQIDRIFSLVDRASRNALRNKL
ncbi:MAG: ribonuclease H [Bacteroidetes bacterium]|jgi:ribonuclease HI|nr:ribonuclease H [Bacteroidota bacterium]MBT5529062.1 ribonuclease H [Cytophagia bacterium]MBT3422797.1 ribonuclease H [Bacteroidota bacterium]MBT3801349.1 ribonuclease H [Bacteroidota bacterium]MBT3934765.1 ribonuclease H [Bacteroidota bacterium]